jgi:hypothetical protein
MLWCGVPAAKGKSDGLGHTEDKYERIIKIQRCKSKKKRNRNAGMCSARRNLKLMRDYSTFEIATIWKTAKPLP